RPAYPVRRRADRDAGPGRLPGRPVRRRAAQVARLAVRAGAEMTGVAAMTSTTVPLAPAVPGLPLLGSILDFRRDILAAMHTGWQSGGDLTRHRLGPVTVHGVSSPELAGEVLTNSAGYGKLGADNPLRLVLGTG